MDIDANIKDFRGDRLPDQRPASFEYCFNYFQSARESGSTTSLAAEPNMPLSCLHLGFYLAS
jgi:hypothetical protein